MRLGLRFSRKPRRWRTRTPSPAKKNEGSQTLLPRRQARSYLTLTHPPHAHWSPALRCQCSASSVGGGSVVYAPKPSTFGIPVRTNLRPGPGESRPPIRITTIIFHSHRPAARARRFGKWIRLVPPKPPRCSGMAAWSIFRIPDVDNSAKSRRLIKCAAVPSSHSAQTYAPILRTRFGIPQDYRAVDFTAAPCPEPRVEAAGRRFHSERDPATIILRFRVFRVLRGETRHHMAITASPILLRIR